MKNRPETSDSNERTVESISSERSSKPDSNSDSVEALFARYADRMMAGEVLDMERIRQDHPGDGERLIQQLRSFQNLANPSSDLSSKTIGEYNVIRLIGRGGMGIVYEGWQTNLERRVAIKVLPSGITADPRAIARFTQEAKLAAQLHHPNIVTVFGMGVENDIPYFVMEYVEGESLAQFLKALKRERADSNDEPTLMVPLSDADESRKYVDTVAQYSENEPTHRSADQQSHLGLEHFLQMAKAFASVADGLQHAHEQGVIHRDVKPSNLIVEVALDDDGKQTKRLQLLDFGLARFEGQETFTRTGDVLGTLLYMSPEQATAGNSSEIDARTDIYSMGVSLYEAITLQPPFDGVTQQDTVDQIINRNPKSPRSINSRVPADLETIILKCLRKQPDERYESAEELAKDLRRFVRGDPIRARPQSTVEKLKRTAWRHRGKLTTAMILGVLIAATTWFGWRSRNAEIAIRRTQYHPKVEQGCREMRKLTELGAYDQVDHELGIYPWGRHLVNQFRSTKVDPKAPAMRPIREAEELFSDAIKLCPKEFSDAYWHRARVRLLLEKDLAALDDLKKTTEITSDHVPALMLMASVLRSRGDNTAADEAKDRAEAAAQQHPWAGHWLEGQRLIQGAQHVAAAEAFTDALEAIKLESIEPFVGADQEIRFLAARCWTMGKVHQRAVEELAVVKSQWDDSLQAQLEHALILFQLGGDENRQRAKQAFVNAYQKSADPEATAIFVARNYINVLRLVKIKVEDHDPEFFQFWLNRIDDEALIAAFRYIEARATMNPWGDDYEKTLKLLEGAVELGNKEVDIRATGRSVKPPQHRDHTDFSLLLAIFHWETSNPQNSITVLREAKEKAPDNPFVNAYLAYFLLAYGQDPADELVKEASSCCEIANDNLRPRDHQGWMMLARALTLLQRYSETPDFDEARACMDKVKYRDAYALDSRGGVFLDAGDILMHRAVTKSPAKEITFPLSAVPQNPRRQWWQLPGKDEIEFFEDAIKEYDELLRRWPSEFPFALRNQVLAYEVMGEREAALQKIEEAFVMAEQFNRPVNFRVFVNFAAKFLNDREYFDRAFQAALVSFEMDGDQGAKTILTGLLRREPKLDLGTGPSDAAEILKRQLDGETDSHRRYDTLMTLMDVYKFLEDDENLRLISRDLLMECWTPAFIQK